MIEAMIDLETWGIRTTSVVRSVGIVVFDGNAVLQEHYFRIPESEQLQARHVGGDQWMEPRTKDSSTMEWWAKPENAEAQKIISDAPLLSWAEGRSIAKNVGELAQNIWAKPGMFDLPMMRDLFGQDIWPYWKERDMSTLIAEFDPERTTKQPFKGTKHVAIDDAKHAHIWLHRLRWKMKPDVATTTEGGQIWSCKIGECSKEDLDAMFPSGADMPMRRAVYAAYQAATGKEPKFLFSGWGASLTVGERAVVENREAKG